MTWAKVLAYIDGEPGSEAVATAALQLGQAFPARVELLHIELSEEQAIPIVAEGMTAGAVGQMLESLREQQELRSETAVALLPGWRLASPMIRPSPAAFGSPSAAFPVGRPTSSPGAGVSPTWCWCAGRSPKSVFPRPWRRPCSKPVGPC